VAPSSVRFAWWSNGFQPSTDHPRFFQPSDASFLGWLADRLAAIQSGTTSFAAPAVEAPHPVQEVLPVESVAAARPIRAESSSSRLLSSALAPLASDQSRGGPSTTAGQKRGLSPDSRDNINKRRSLGTGGVPTAPKALRGEDDGDVRMDGDEEERRRQRPAGQRNGRPSLLDRIAGPPNGSVVDSTGVDRPVRNMRGRGGRMDRRESALRFDISPVSPVYVFSSFLLAFFFSFQLSVLEWVG
jgi:hypothetical protein